MQKTYEDSHNPLCQKIGKNQGAAQPFSNCHNCAYMSHMSCKNSNKNGQENSMENSKKGLQFI